MRELFNLLVWICAFLVLLGGGLYYFVVDVWTVPTDDPLLAASIQPTLHAGDVLVIMRSPSVERGNLVRCPDPQGSGRFVVGRAIARGGERMILAGGSVNVDQWHATSPRACDDANQTVFDPARNENVSLACRVQEIAGREYEELHSMTEPDAPLDTRIESSKWYLISDDRHVHLDSRDYGAVDPSTCQRIALRLVGAAGITDPSSRFTLIW